MNRRVEIVMQISGPGRTAEDSLRMLEGQREECGASQNAGPNITIGLESLAAPAGE